MKLLLLLESWGSGGTEQYVRTLYPVLKELAGDIEIHLVLIVVQFQTVPVRNNGGKNDAACGGFPRRMALLRRLMQQQRPDICHLHLYTSTMCAVIATRLAVQTKLVASFHSPISQWNWRHRIGFRIATAMCDTVIGASEFTAGQLRKWRPDVVTASPPISGVSSDTDPSVACTPRAEQTQDSLQIISVGRLSSEKEFHILIDAIPKLEPLLLDRIRCELIGDGPLREVLQQQINMAGLENHITLSGSLPHDETLRHVAAADLFVLPSRFEGFGMAAVEAMALGVPTITANFPAATEYLTHGVTGHQFPIGNAEELAKLIHWHAKNRDESQRIGETGQKSVTAKYSPTKLAEIHQKVYANC